MRPRRTFYHAPYHNAAHLFAVLRYRRSSDGSSSSGEANDAPDVPASDRLDKLESLHLTFNLESGLMLPLALR